MPATDELDRLSPLQRSVLHALRGGDALGARDVFRLLDRLTPLTLEGPFPDAVLFAVRRSLERLDALGFVLAAGDGRYALAESTRRVTTYSSPRATASLSA